MMVLPAVMEAVGTNADDAALHVLRGPRELRLFLAPGDEERGLTPE
jgi:hypothetical protein